jgi:hypothetical protein
MTQADRIEAAAIAGLTGSSVADLLMSPIGSTRATMAKEVVAAAAAVRAAYEASLPPARGAGPHAQLSVGEPIGRWTDDGFWLDIDACRRMGIDYSLANEICGHVVALKREAGKPA